MENGIKLKSYQINFVKLKKKIYEEEKRLYDITINVIRFNELQKHAGKMKKLGKPSTSGTKITFEPVQTVEEYEEELKRIIEEGKTLGLEFEEIKTDI